MNKDEKDNCPRIAILGGTHWAKVLAAALTALDQKYDFICCGTDNDTKDKGDLMKVLAIKASPMIPFLFKSHENREVCVPSDNWPKWRELEQRAQNSRLGIKKPRSVHTGYRQKSTIFRGKGKK